MTRRTLIYLLLLCIACSARSAELVTLSEANFAEYAPQGKEADAIIGDYVLRNDKIVAAVADPTLLMGQRPALVDPECGRRAHRPDEPREPE